MSLRADARAANMSVIAIPGALNIAIAITAYATAAGLLVLASRAAGWPARIACAIAFSYVGNTIFSLLHESVHGIFHRRRAVNDAFGVVSAAFFPTSFSFQRTCHLGHHLRNRTDDELFDYYYPHDSRVLKCYRLYSLLTGFYWLSVPVGCAVYVVAPWLFRARVFRERVAGTMGMTPMVEGLQGARLGRIRLEAAVTVGVQAALVLGLGVSAGAWWLCYGAFALNWCSLQYTDHAWSPRDVRDGAWNLRVNPVVRALFLNYHHHRAHHRHPKVPWLHLPRYVDDGEARPSFLGLYLSLWKGPRPVTAPPPGPDGELERQLFG